MSIEALVEVSRFYGKNPDYVIAGGGNTSFKDSDTLYIKGSGQALANVVPDSFVAMDRKALAGIWEKTYSNEEAEREKAVLSDLLAARRAGEERKRPSVETMLHDLLPFKYVVHLHPALVNGMTCSRRGAAAMAEVFGEEAIWIPSTNPGYVLSKKVKTALDNYRAAHGRPSGLIFLQNHGIFVGGNDTEDIKDSYRDIMERLEKKIKRQPDFSGEAELNGEAEPNDENRTLDETTSALKEISGASVAFLHNREIAALVRDRDSFYPVSSAFTPDHIVYAGSDPLYTNAGDLAALSKDWKNHIDKTGRAPKITAVRGLGVFGLGSSDKNAALALELFKDAVKVAVYSESFGGPEFMSRDQIDFINNWEVEQFRAKVSTK